MPNEKDIEQVLAIVKEFKEAEIPGDMARRLFKIQLGGIKVTLIKRDTKEGPVRGVLISLPIKKERR